MSGTVNFNRTFSQSVALSDLTISDADTNLVVKNTSDSTPDDVTINIKFRDNNNNDAMTLGVQDKVVEVKNNCNNGTTKLTSGAKSLTIDEQNNLSTFNTDLKSNSVQLAGSTSGKVTIDPAASVTDYTVTLPNSQGTADSYLKNDGAGTLTWGNLSNFTLPTASTTVLGGVKVGNNLSIDGSGVLSAPNAWSSFSTMTSGFTDTDTKATIDITSFNSADKEELHVLVETNLHANSFTLYKGLLPSIASAGYAYELGKYDTRYLLYSLSNSGNTLIIQSHQVTLVAVKMFSR